MSDIVVKPGIYDIAIDDYHTQRCFPGPSISSSGLKKIDGECPARFWAMSDLNPRRFPEKDRKALAFGRAAHALVLGEPEFNSKFIISPFDNFMSKEARAWRDAQSRQIVKAEEWSVIQDMAAAQKSSPEVMRAFTNGQPEKSIVWQDEETGIWLKSRPDWLPNKPAESWLVDYKTAETLRPRRLNSAVFEYGYEMQAALAMDGLKIVTGKPVLGFAHVVQEKDPPYLAEARLFTEEQTTYGRMRYRRALRIFAKCIETGIWPGYSSEPQYYETPFWVSKAMENFNDDIGNGTEFTGADYLATG